ncbi:hypothetical protein [Paraclostridium sordellii]|uniref:hypothetical protein n=1 Tax=Paraclostridium sordellii TaxID=1505 RepID=UPI000385D590|nr:hypothetical protein [Paeniclostridium sordellii]AUO31728.1 hypothetical protein [Paeniclostridium sordellii]EPZ61104.1 hypothetical protein H476_0300 [[Clostridium] sordellii VPI 9048] [Paeniclostridium sordellii VPI 9048]CEK40076.1 hypothetical protein JGS6382_PCS1300351 (plasmid) [[Clostridium] sordellii] [Paeniclostridium sordellii]
MSEKLSRKELKILKKEEKQQAKIEKKELKEEHKKVKKVASDLLPFLNIADDGSIQTKYGYMEIYQIATKDLNSLTSDETNMHISELTTFLRGYSDDIKIICMSYPVNTEVQQTHLSNKIQNTDNDIYIKFLNKKLERLKLLEKLRTNKEFYLVLYFKNERDKREKEIYIQRKANRAMGIEPIDINKKVKILYKLNNQNSKI